jgi:hypothetical protein
MKIKINFKKLKTRLLTNKLIINCLNIRTSMKLKKEWKIITNNQKRNKVK